LHQRRFFDLRLVAKPPMVAKMVTKIYFAPPVITSRNAASIAGGSRCESLIECREGAKIR
jgi:hypothetical protein